MKKSEKYMSKARIRFKAAKEYFKCAAYGYSQGVMFWNLILLALVEVVVVLAVLELTVGWMVFHLILSAFSIASLLYWTPIIAGTMKEHWRDFIAERGHELNKLHAQLNVRKAEDYANRSAERMATAMAT